MTTTARITSVVQGTDRVVVSFVREPAGFRGTLEFPEREPWMRRGVEVTVGVEPGRVPLGEPQEAGSP